MSRVNPTAYGTRTGGDASGRRVRSVAKLRLQRYGGAFLLLPQRSRRPREMVVTPKASTSLSLSLYIYKYLSLSLYIYIYIYTYIYIPPRPRSHRRCGRLLLRGGGSGYIYMYIYIYIYIYIKCLSCVDSYSYSDVSRVPMVSPG